MVKFSIVMPIYNSDKYLKECLDSVLNQTFEDFEVICIDDGSTDNSKAILEDYAKKDNRVKVYSQENQGVGAARNHGLNLAEGKYINFLDSDDYLSPNALKSVHDFFEKHYDEIDVVSIPIFFSNEKNHSLNNKFNLKDDPKDKIIDILEEEDAIQSSVNSTFIKSECIDDLKFETDVAVDEGLIFINKILLLKNRMGLVKDAKYYFGRTNHNSLQKIGKDKKSFYAQRLRRLRELIDYSKEKNGSVHEYIQNSITYSLKSFEKIENLPEYLTKDEINEFWECFYELLSDIDEEALFNTRIIKKKKIYFSRFLMYIKNHKEFHTEMGEDEDGKAQILLKTKDLVINTLDKHKIFLDIVELKDGFMNISGNFVSSCANEALRIEAIKISNGKKEVYKGKHVEYPRTTRRTKRYLGIDWRFNYNFDLKIPIEKDEETRIDFRTIYEEDGKKHIMKSKIGFRRFAELSKYSHYYIRDSQIVTTLNKSIHIMPYRYSKALRLEVSSFKKILTSKQKYRFQAIFYRLLYLILLPKMKDKRIYMFMDRRDSTGDNGEHLFRYAYDQNDGIRKYFALTDDCNEYKKLKGEYGKNILKFGSIKHKTMYMFTEKLISSQGYKNHVNPFADKNLKLVQGISSPPIYFLQHGVVKYNRTNWLRKYDFNFSLMLAVSDLDYRAFVENYNYDKEIIQNLGFPRFDNLTNENIKKEIIIIPTWRQALRTTQNLLDSEYFSRWNNLLKNKELMDFAKENGYKIIYKPHPNSKKFLEFFNTEYVEVEEKRRFHDILCESALMITDYSSVHFDFAYLNKPVIYYQYGDPSIEIPELGDSLIEEDLCTFGAVIKEEEDLINKIKEYIINDCKIEDEYRDRVINFFKFNDKNNCKRVYDWILKH